MTVDKLIAHFERMEREHWAYSAGGSSTGAVDCSGAFVWAFRQEGESIYHGSNRIQRTEIVEMLPISQWEPGMAAFKKRAPGDDYYALPQGYLPGGGHYNGDISDYYHIGLMDDGGMVLNAQSTATGFVRSKLDGSWCGVARLKKVTYPNSTEKGGDGMAVVTTPDGNPAKLRKDPSTDNPYLDKLQPGTAVTVLGTAVAKDGLEWSKIGVAGRVGYIMTKYIKEAEKAENDPLQDETEAFKDMTLLEEINGKLDTILDLLGGGAVG